MSDASPSVDDARLELYAMMRQDVAFEQKAEQALALGETYLGVDNAHLTRIDPDADYWEAIVSTDAPDGEFPPGLVLDLDTTYCRRVLHDGETVALHDAPEQGWEDDPAFEEHGPHCYHGTPLTVDGDTYGTLCFVSESPREDPFDDADTLFAELIARLLEHELELQQRTAELTQRSNLVTVLSRVLRRNIRNDVTVIRGELQHLHEQVDLPETAHAPIERTSDIIDLAEKARQFEQIVDTEFDRETVDVTALVDRIAADTDDQHPAASITVETPGSLEFAAMPSLETAIREVLVNAATHAGEAPTITVTVSASTTGVDIAVTDDGPGLPEVEREVLAEGEETSLVHGRGLGLWLVNWIVTSHGGTVDIDASEAGTTVCLSLPRDQAGLGSPEQSIENRLQRGYDRFRAVFDDAFDAMIVVDDDGRITDANDSAAALFGESTAELLGRELRTFATQDTDITATWEDFMDAEQGVVPIVDAEGTERAVEYSATPDIVPGQHLVVAREATDRIERERTLETRERALREAYEIIADGDRSLAEQIDALLSVGREVIGTDYATFSHIDGDQYEFEAIAVADDVDLEAGTTAPLVELPICERVFETEDTLVLGDVSAAAPELVDPAWGIACYLGAPVVVDGEPYGTFCFYDVEPRAAGFSEWETTFVELLGDWVGSELSRQRATERVQRQNERLDEFASVVSHDLKNPLNVADGNLALAEDEVDSDHLDEVRYALDRMETLVEDLLARVRDEDDVSAFETVDGAEIIEECWQSVATGDATLVASFDGTIQADAGRLAQLLENLFANAVAHGGEDVTITVGAIDGGLYVADDGPGIPPDEREQVFEAGYSSAADNTGLGLAIVQDIAAAHGWTVDITDSEDGGTRIEITGIDITDR